MNRNRTSLLAVLLCLSLTRCINLPDIDPGESDPPDTPDVEEPLPDLSVQLLTPVATTYTNGAVDVSVEVTNGTPEAVDLFAGDELLTTLTSPYTFRWDTSTKPEGSYALTAKARRGTKTFTSEARQVVVDRTPPEVVFLTPGSGTHGVRVSASIEAAISEALDPRFITSASARMKVNGNDVAANVKLSADGKLLTLEPSAAMALPAEVEVALTDGLRDLSGNSLRALSSGWNWSVPDFLFVDQVLKVAGQRTASPSMQLDSLGRPVIAVVAGNNGYVQRWTGNSWEQLGGELNTPGNRLSLPSLQIDSSGRPAVAWSEETSNGTDVYVKRWSGSEWEPIGNVLSVMPGDTPASLSSLQLDAAGNPVVAFTENDGQARNVYVWRWDGSAWGAVGGPLSAKPGNTHANDASLRLDALGNPIVAWRELGDNSFDTAYVSRWAEGQWKMLGSILGPSPGSVFVDEISLTLDLSGNPIIGIFRGGVAASRGLYVLQWAGDQWQPLGGSVAAIASKPSLQADATGRLAIAWMKDDGIHVMRWMGTDWESLGGNLRAYPNSSSIQYPVLQLNADGYPVVAWGEALGADGGVYVASFNY